MEKEIKMTIIMFKEDEWWNAQCLEYDIASQGKTIKEAQFEYQKIICSMYIVAEELGINNPFQGIPPAPQFLHEMARNTDNVVRLEFKIVEHLCDEAIPEYMLPKEALLYEANAA